MQLQFLICFENDNFPILQFAIIAIAIIAIAILLLYLAIY